MGIAPRIDLRDDGSAAWIAAQIQGTKQRPASRQEGVVAQQTKSVTVSASVEGLCSGQYSRLHVAPAAASSSERSARAAAHASH